jgi:hypothetical protein
MVDLFVFNGKYGIIDNGDEAVGAWNNTKEEAIGEWYWFEKANATGRQFLKHKRSIKEIEQIVEKLLSQKI